MSNMIKCNKCGGESTTSTRICEYCGAILEGEGKTLNDSLNELNESFNKLRSFPSPGLLDSFKNNAKFSMPILSLITLFLTFKINGFFGIPFVVFLVYAILSLFKKKQNLLGGFKADKLLFNTQLASLYGIYGKDPSTSARLGQIEKEFKNIDKLFKKSKSFELIMYVILIGLFIFSYIIPATKTEMEIKNEIVNSEASILLVADSLLSNGNYTEAKKILKDLKSKESTIELQSNIQLREIEDLFKSIENQINNKEYDLAKNELQLIIWKKNSTELDLEMIEEKYFKRYIQLKTNLNGKLPEENRAQVESEIDF
jgi:hypothetical protein